MTMRTESKIEVRFTIYQYNSGAGDNGCRKIKEIYPVTEEGIVEATAFAQEIQDALAKGRQEGHGQGGRSIASEYCWDGFIKSFDGLIRVDSLREEVEHVLG